MDYTRTFLISLPNSVKFDTKDLHIMQLSNLSFVKTDAVQAVTLLSTKKKGKVHPCTGTEALYRPCGP